MPLALTTREIAAGTLATDPQQHAILVRLDQLARQLEKPSRLLSRFLTGNEANEARGLYIWGPVGRGKTMLMDLFFAAVRIKAKRRVHFHAFMQEVHAGVHRMRQDASLDDPVGAAARELVGDLRLLCLDEMQVSDIADAMLVGRLFKALFDEGVVVVTTSNLPPDRLYENGLNRQLFLPFIALMRERLDVMELDGPKDYRLGRVKGYETFVTPLGYQADARIDELWRRLTDTDRGEPMEIALKGRSLHVPQAARGAARFTFAELCEAPLGPADYLALAREFRVVFVEHIPILGHERRNEAKRFVLLIDVLYEAHGRLVASAEAPPDALHAEGDHAFEFRRTASRLEEMRSASWWGGRIVET
jgi:cell division protein ZapE